MCNIAFMSSASEAQPTYVNFVIVMLCASSCYIGPQYIESL